MILFIRNVFFLSVSKFILLFFIFCYFAFFLRSTCIYKEVAEALQSELNMLLLDLKRKTNINLIQKTRKTKHKKKASFYLFILVLNFTEREGEGRGRSKSVGRKLRFLIEAISREFLADVRWPLAQFCVCRTGREL